MWWNKHIRRYLLTLCCILVSAFASAQNCDCAQPPDITTAFEQSDAVVWGTLADATTNWMSGGGKLTFQVEWCWKKAVENYLPVNTPADPACAFPFEGGKYYLIFLEKKFSWKTTRCSGNLEVPELHTAIQLLGPGQAPGIDVSVTNRMMMFLIWSTIAGLLLVLFIVLRRKFLPKAK